MIVVVGATGQLGGRIAHHLRRRGAAARFLVRGGDGEGTPREKIAPLAHLGAVLEVDFSDEAALARAMAGSTCVVSAVSGLEDVIIDFQTRLLNAALVAHVPRFIPSDFCVDYTKLPAGQNRNLDLRRTFAERLDAAPIAATSILSGMFADLLVDKAPLVLFPLRTVVYWGSADQPLDFTTMDDTASFTAAAAMDAVTPRHLRIAGTESTARELCAAASEATGQTFHLVRAGSVKRLDFLSRVAHRVAPHEGDVFPAWQGMQYLRDMFDGAVKLEPIDNGRYRDIAWTRTAEVLARRVQSEGRRANDDAPSSFQERAPSVAAGA